MNSLSDAVGLNDLDLTEPPQSSIASLRGIPELLPSYNFDLFLSKGTNAKLEADTFTFSILKVKVKGKKLTINMLATVDAIIPKCGDKLIWVLYGINDKIVMAMELDLTSDAHIDFESDGGTVLADPLVHFDMKYDCKQRLLDAPMLQIKMALDKKEKEKNGV